MTKKLNITLTVIRALEEQGVLAIESEQVFRTPLKETGRQEEPVDYTPEQRRIIDRFREDYHTRSRVTRI